MRCLTRLLLALSLSLPLSTAFAADWSVDALMKLLGARKESRARFIEHKYLALLDSPVESSGTLSFRAPDRMEKRTEKPRQEIMQLQGDVLSLTRDGQTRQVNLGDYRDVAILVNSIRATLAGDRSTLETSFALSLAGDRHAWTLSLLPRDGQLATIVQRITLEGSQDRLRRVEILQGDGDRSEMLINDEARS